MDERTLKDLMPNVESTTNVEGLSKTSIQKLFRPFDKGPTTIKTANWLNKTKQSVFKVSNTMRRNFQVGTKTIGPRLKSVKDMAFKLVNTRKKNNMNSIAGSAMTTNAEMNSGRNRKINVGERYMENQAIGHKAVLNKSTGRLARPFKGWAGRGLRAGIGGAMGLAAITGLSLALNRSRHGR